MTKYLIFTSLVFSLGGLSSNNLVCAQSLDDCFKSSVPKFSSALYSTSIDVVGHHISGLLFLKIMPDSSQRAVFSNEAGITFFDFEWKKNGAFKTYKVIKRLRKRLVLNTLRKDFELVLVPTAIVKSIERKGVDNEYFTSRRNEKLIFKTNPDCQSFAAIDVMGRKKKLVEARFFPKGNNIPDSVSILHHNFDMKIGLKRLAQ